MCDGIKLPGGGVQFKIRESKLLNNFDTVEEACTEFDKIINKKENRHMENIEKTEQIDKILSNVEIPEDIRKDNEKFNKDLDNILDEYNAKKEEIIKEEANAPEMTIEEMNNVPATDVNLSDEDTVNAFNKALGTEITDDDAMQLLQVIKDYKSGKKFKVFDALPQVLKDKIAETAKNAGNTDKSLIEFFSKTFINDIIVDSGIGIEIDNFNKEMEEATKGMDNITGLVIDEYTEELKDKFGTNLTDLADKVEEEDPEKAKKLRMISKAYQDATTMSSVLEMINKKPSLISNAYKDAYYHYNTQRDEFNKSFNTNPRLKNIDVVRTSLLKNYACPNDIAECVTILIMNSIYARTEIVKETYFDTDSMRDATRYLRKFNNISDHVYAYYTLVGFVNLNFTAKRSKTVNDFAEYVLEVINTVLAYRIKVEEEKESKNKKKGKGAKKKRLADKRSRRKKN